VLAPRGELVFLVRAPRPGFDASDVPRLAHEQGLDVIANGERIFVEWDGLTYRLKRRA
jgi:hypothetical protein